jgi:hypothetical protein
MARSLVVCPATESLELIEFVESPLGALIHACSRFRPATALACGRTCAQRGRCDLGSSEPAFELDEEDDDEDTAIDLAPVPEISTDPV